MCAPVLGRPIRGLLCAAAACLLPLAAPIQAQNTQNDLNKRCIDQYNAVMGSKVLDPENAAVLATGCVQVANAVSADWSTNALLSTPPSVDPRDVSATRDQTTASPGDVTTPVEPVEAAGGSVAAVGTDKGTGAVAAIAINPSIFFVNPSDAGQVARWSRFTDVTLLVPASDLDNREEDGGDEDEGTDYVGIRWGLNFTGFRRGGAVHQAAVEAYNRFLSGLHTQNVQIQRLLRAAPSDDALKTCLGALAAAKALDADTRAEITKACGGAPDPDDPAAITGLQEAIQAARIEADSRYFGLDLRADFGDLSLAGVDTVPGTSIFAGLGWGARSVRNTQTSTGLRAHGGARYWDTDDEDEDQDGENANFAVEAGVAFEAIRFYDYQRLTLVGGVDGRLQTTGAADDEEKGSINFRASLNVPVTSTASVSVNLVAPMVGERRGPVLSIKGNWRLLRSRSF